MPQQLILSIHVSLLYVLLVYVDPIRLTGGISMVSSSSVFRDKNEVTMP
jgi:hypothetical protein